MKPTLLLLAAPLALSVPIAAAGYAASGPAHVPPLPRIAEAPHKHIRGPRDYPHVGLDRHVNVAASFAQPRDNWNQWVNAHQDGPPITLHMHVPSSTSSSSGHSAVQTKCSRNEITAATCARDGFAGGYGPTSGTTSTLTMAQRRSATYQRPAKALAMVQTKCLRGEMTAKTCHADGFPGGY